MCLKKEIVLSKLRTEAERIQPGVLIGWDLAVSPLGPEDADLILEIFMLPKSADEAFMDDFYPALRSATKELGLAITPVFHDPAASEKFYSDAVSILRNEYAETKPEVRSEKILDSFWRFDMSKAWVSSLPMPLHT